MPKSSGCAPCFKALGVPSRLKIYKFLIKNGKATVTDIVNVAGLTQPTVSYHLKEMKDLGMLLNKRVGKEVYYSVNLNCHTYNKTCFLSKVNLEDKNNA